MDKRIYTMQPPLIIIVDSEIVLRSTIPAHADEIFNLVDKNRNYLQEWLPWVVHTVTVQDTISYIAGINHHDIYSESFGFSIFYGQHIVGKIGFVRGIKAERQLEIGYWLAEDMQGLGIISRSVKELVKFGFENSDARTIKISANIQNKKSCSIAERLAFRKGQPVIKPSKDHNNDIVMANYFLQASDHLWW